MSAQLVPLSAGSYPIISLQRPVLLIGRHPECDVRLELSKVSRRHCCVAMAYDRVMVRDLGSRNGLRVNGRLVDEAQLSPGDEVAIGPILYRMEVEQPAAASPVPSSPANAAAPAQFPGLPDLPTPDPNDPDGDLIPIDL